MFNPGDIVSGTLDGYAYMWNYVGPEGLGGPVVGRLFAHDIGLIVANVTHANNRYHLVVSKGMCGWVYEMLISHMPNH